MSKGIEIKVCPLKRLYLELGSHCDGVAAVISTSGAPDPEKLRGIPHVIAQYRDIDYETPGAFSWEDASRFAAFVKALDPKITTLYCVCDAAQSRSPAVAAAVSRYFGRDALEQIWRDPQYHPNMLVFEKLCEALGVPVGDAELDLYLFESRKAFKNAISWGRK